LKNNIIICSEYDIIIERDKRLIDNLGTKHVKFHPCPEDTVCRVEYQNGRTTVKPIDIQSGNERPAVPILICSLKIRLAIQG
jgi:hypothetical protein